MYTIVLSFFTGMLKSFLGTSQSPYVFSFETPRREVLMIDSAIWLSEWWRYWCNDRHDAFGFYDENFPEHTGFKLFDEISTLGQSNRLHFVIRDWQNFVIMTGLIYLYKKKGFELMHNPHISEVEQGRLDIQSLGEEIFQEVVAHMENPEYTHLYPKIEGKFSVESWKQGFLDFIYLRLKDDEEFRASLPEFGNFGQVRPSLEFVGIAGIDKRVLAFAVLGLVFYLS